MLCISRYSDQVLKKKNHFHSILHPVSGEFRGGALGAIAPIQKNFFDFSQQKRSKNEPILLQNTFFDHDRPHSPLNRTHSKKSWIRHCGRTDTLTDSRVYSLFEYTKTKHDVNKIIFLPSFFIFR